MPVERHFLDWNVPVTEKAVEFLLPSPISGPVDMGDQLIMVPTRQAGRRLRAAMALRCAEQKTALLSPRVVTPAFLLRSINEPVNLANRTEIAAVWADVLMRANITEYGGLFPAQTPKQDFAWAMYTGNMVQDLRDTLVEGSYRIEDIYETFNSILQEPERWRDLAGLEKAYLARLQGLGLRDPCDMMIEYSEKPDFVEGIKRIVIVAVPDPTPLVVQALEHLAERLPVLILVHAPKLLADHFDDWGRPVTAKWNSSQIDIPDGEKNIFLAASPVSQSLKTLEIMVEESGRFGPGDIAIGVPDSEIVPFLAADLAGKGLDTFNPAGKSATEHMLYHLLGAFYDMVNESTYLAFSMFLRHSDVLNFFQRKYNLSPRWILEELDRVQNACLPLAVEDVTRYFKKEKEERFSFQALEKAVGFIMEQIDAFNGMEFDGALRLILQTLYDGCRVNLSNEEDGEFIAVAGLIDSTLREFNGGLIGSLGIDQRQSLELLIWRLRDQKYYSERQGTIIDLEGWLELPWNDAPLLIVTGMNEGKVPDGRLSDSFLPDSLRVQLNLRHDADRLARDTYLMSSLIESRREKGRICFIAGKTSCDGDPLKPSRLLFRCDDAELPRRAGQLFGYPYEKRCNFPATVSFPLEVVPPADIPTKEQDLNKIRITEFKDYLDCPFRFYLKHVLGMQEINDEKGELDAMDFGYLVHDVLRRMGENKELRRCDSALELRNFLYSEAERWVTERFGLAPSLQIKIQLDAARQRLDAAARVQAGLVREGWEILECEMPVEVSLEGLLVTGRIDRIDRHRGTGCIRILDYKTSDKATDPRKAHIGPASSDTRSYMKVMVNGKQNRWIDLQLPLYIILTGDKDDFNGPVELGYFNLPESVSDTGVVIWEGLDDEFLASARNCAMGIVKDVKNRRFWPPAKRIAHDEFESLFHADVPVYINLETFEAFMKR